MEVDLEGADSKAEGSGADTQHGVSHYALQPDPAAWIYGVPHFGAVTFHTVYTGVDLRYHLSGSDVEFDFEAAKPADLARIKLRFNEDVHVSQKGDLVLEDSTLRRPTAWQVIRGERQPVEARYHLVGHRRVVFALGPHDASAPTTLDPIIDFATFLGGSSAEIDTQLAVDAAGNIYMAGSTLSVDFPASQQPPSPLNVPVTLRDPLVYVARLKPDASATDWSFFIGGTASQRCGNLLLDSLGDIYVFGATTSANFPVTPGAWKTTIDPSLSDEFVVKLDAKTGIIKASTYLGLKLNLGADAVLPSGGFAADYAGGVYASGITGNDFQTTPGAYLGKTAAIEGLYEAFGILRLNAGLSSVVYATYMDIGVPNLLQADPAGNLIFTGSAGFVTPAPGFPAINPISGISQNPGGPNQPFIAKLNAAGTALVYASLLSSGGGSVSDLQTDNEGNAWVAGWATDLPQVNPLQLEPDPAQPPNYLAPAFFAEIPPQGGSLLQSTLFNQPGTNVFPASPVFIKLVRLPGGRLCFVGIGVKTQTTGGLVGTNPSYGTTDLSCTDASGEKVGIKTILPATQGGYSAVQPTPDGAIFFAGTADQGFQTTPGVVQPIFGGSFFSDAPGSLNSGDAFLMRVSFSNPIPEITSVFPDSVFLSASPVQTFNLAGSGFAYGTQVTWNGKPVASTFNSSSQIAVSGSIPTIQAGPNQVGASLAGPGGGVSKTVTVTAYNLAPGTPFITPASVPAGSSETKVVIYAAGLTPASVLTWNGAVRTATLVAGSDQSSNYLELLLEPPELAQPSSSTVTITNPGPGGGVSAPSQFIVQAVSGVGVPSVSGPPLFAFDESTPVPATLTLSGAGFATGTIATWDGATVPASYVSATQLKITPPAGSLSTLGVHDVQVANGALRSAKIRFPVVRSINSSYNFLPAFDASHEILYLLIAPQTLGSPFDLLTYDARTGKQTGDIAGVISSPRAFVVSDDGSFLYMAGGPSGDEIKRFNIAKAAFDLDWQVEMPARFVMPTVEALAAVAGSPQTLIVVATGESNFGGSLIMIFDRDQQRPLTSNFAPGGCCAFPTLFATANRIFLTGVSTYPCLEWLDFDDDGITGGSSQCGLNPPELVISHGFAWLTDGTRTITVNFPYGIDTSIGGYPLSPQAWQIDPIRRLAYVIIPGGYLQILQMNLDTLQQTTLPQTSLSLYESVALYLSGDGSLRVLTPSWLAEP